MVLGTNAGESRKRRNCCCPFTMTVTPALTAASTASAMACCVPLPTNSCSRQPGALGPLQASPMRRLTCLSIIGTSFLIGPESTAREVSFLLGPSMYPAACLPETWPKTTQSARSWRPIDCCHGCPSNLLSSIKPLDLPSALTTNKLVSTSSPPIQYGSPALDANKAHAERPTVGLTFCSHLRQTD